MRFSLLVLLTITGLDLSLSHAAIAADMPVKAPVYAPPLVPAPYNWTGVFLSTNFGGSWSNGSASIVGTAWNPGATAFIGGFELGYNWQIGHFLIGVEGDFDGSVFGLPNATLLTPLGPVHRPSKLDQYRRRSCATGFQRSARRTRENAYPVLADIE